MNRPRILHQFSNARLEFAEGSWSSFVNGLDGRNFSSAPLPCNAKQAGENSLCRRDHGDHRKKNSNSLSALYRRRSYALYRLAPSYSRNQRSDPVDEQCGLTHQISHSAFCRSEEPMTETESMSMNESRKCPVTPPGRSLFLLPLPEADHPRDQNRQTEYQRGDDEAVLPQLRQRSDRRRNRSRRRCNC